MRILDTIEKTKEKKYVIENNHIYVKETNEKLYTLNIFEIFVDEDIIKEFDKEVRKLLDKLRYEYETKGENNEN